MILLRRLLTICNTSKTLPHRFPFLLVDKIIDPTDEKNRDKECYFQRVVLPGHFPNNPVVMPGVLQIEALGYCGGGILGH